MIQAKQLNAEIASGKRVSLIDVRTPAEHGEVHIEGSHLMPLDRLDAGAVRSAASGAERCVLVCRSGKRAEQAYQKLQAAGCENMEVLDGGVIAWESAGLPVVRGAKAISLERQVRIAAGMLVLLGVILGAWVHPAFYGLSAFVGAGLWVRVWYLQASPTGAAWQWCWRKCHGIRGGGKSRKLKAES
jgi:rhodanese-related sulfurtransferase